MRLDGLRRVGGLIRALHDASAPFTQRPGAGWDVVLPAEQEELVCHNDLAPWNLVCGHDRWVFIDWDGAGPSTRLWDLAYAAQSFVALAAGGAPQLDGRRLPAFGAGYGLTADQRQALPLLLGGRARAMYDLLVDGARTGHQPWACTPRVTATTGVPRRTTSTPTSPHGGRH